MNWFKETQWLVKQLFTTTKNKDKETYQNRRIHYFQIKLIIIVKVQNRNLI